MTAMGNRLGVMGGTFDPIHYGHLVTAEEALQQFGLDGVIFVPTGQPWMKEHEVVSPPEDRYLMTVIATASNPLFRVSRMEVDRDGPTFTVDTLRGLKAELGTETDLFFVTGADAVLEIFQWKDPGELFELAHFIAATRPGYDIAGFSAHAPEQAPRHHGDERPRPGDLVHRHPGPRGRLPSDPVPGARGREELHREGGALPVRSGSPPGGPVRGSRAARHARHRRTLALEIVAGIVAVALAGWFLFGRGGGGVEPGGKTPSPEGPAGPSRLLALSIPGTALAAHGGDRDRERGPSRGGVPDPDGDDDGRAGPGGDRDRAGGAAPRGVDAGRALEHGRGVDRGVRGDHAEAAGRDRRPRGRAHGRPAAPRHDRRRRARARRHDAHRCAGPGAAGGPGRRGAHLLGDVLDGLLAAPPTLQAGRPRRLERRTSSCSRSSTGRRGPRSPGSPRRSWPAR